MLLIAPDGHHLSLSDTATQVRSFTEGVKDRSYEKKVLLLWA
jgi:hypothetical protein